jgi:hypothetical protein
LMGAVWVNRDQERKRTYHELWQACLGREGAFLLRVVAG